MSLNGTIFGSPALGYGRCTALDAQSRPCQRYADTADGLCSMHRFVIKYSPQEQLMLQVAKSIRNARGNVRTFAWPYPRLHELTGPLVQGHVTVIGAASGGGKTTFAYDLVRRWVTSGIGVTVIPTETRPEEWRQGIAATCIGIPAGDTWDIIHRAKAGDAVAVETALRLENALLMQVDDPVWAKGFATLNDEEISVKGLDRACELTKLAGHDVLLIDHGDQTESERDPITGRRPSLVEVGQEISDAILKLAKAHEIHVVVMSQAKAGLDHPERRLLKYRPLSMDDFAGSAKKIRNASNIIGLYRPIRLGISRDTVTLANEGAIDVFEALATDRMGVNGIKLRFRGSNVGKTIELKYQGGQLHDLTASEVEHDRALAQMAIDARRSK